MAADPKAGGTNLIVVPVHGPIRRGSSAIRARCNQAKERWASLLHSKAAGGARALGKAPAQVRNKRLGDGRHGAPGE